MGVERDDGGPQPGSRGRLEHARVTTVHAVEGADGDGAPRRLELLGAARDVHSAASTSASSSRRPGSNSSGVTASSTENGPTAVRRNVTQ